MAAAAAAEKKKEAVIKERDVIELVRGSIRAPTVICQVTTVQNIPEFSEERNFLVNVQMNRFLTVQFLFFFGEFILKLVLVPLLHLDP